MRIGARKESQKINPETSKKTVCRFLEGQNSRHNESWICPDSIPGNEQQKQEQLSEEIQN